MFGAALGDIVGSKYEFDPIKRKDFQLLTLDMDYTDDTIMTCAVLEALIGGDLDNEEETKRRLVSSMVKWGHRYPDPKGSYGGMFYSWLFSSSSHAPYNSWGNGSAMRVSGAGWLYENMEETRKAARLSAEVTHNHREGIKGAEATAAAIFIARKGGSKEEIKAYISKEFGYDLDRSLGAIRPIYSFDGSSQGTVPESIICFLEGESTEDSIRNAVSLGGDADTMGAIAGSIAEAYWKEDLSSLVKPYLPTDIYGVLSMV